jgi:mRNA interferase RelE/StbE
VKVSFRASFVKDLRALDSKYTHRVQKMIGAIESANTLRDIPQLKKLQGYSEFFRVRIGAYRLGLALIGGEIILVRCLPRKDIYRQFP